jgi:hypothetical protein
MPKDTTKNVDRYKIGGGHLNEYEFEQDKPLIENKNPRIRSGKTLRRRSIQRRNEVSKEIRQRSKGNVVNKNYVMKRELRDEAKV